MQLRCCEARARRLRRWVASRRLQLRIGWNSGALIAGVIGTHKFV